MSNKDLFMKTSDETTAQKLISCGFQLVNESNGVYVFCNDATKLMFEKIDTSKVMFTNILHF